MNGPITDSHMRFLFCMLLVELFAHYLFVWVRSLLKPGVNLVFSQLKPFGELNRRQFIPVAAAIVELL
jgi:hypothetical protein